MGKKKNCSQNSTGYHENTLGVGFTSKLACYSNNWNQNSAQWLRSCHTRPASSRTRGAFSQAQRAKDYPQPAASAEEAEVPLRGRTIFTLRSILLHSEYVFSSFPPSSAQFPRLKCLSSFLPSLSLPPFLPFPFLPSFPFPSFVPPSLLPH